MKKLIKKFIVWAQVPLTGLAQIAGFYGYMVVADADCLTVLFMQNKPAEPIKLTPEMMTSRQEVIH